MKGKTALPVDGTFFTPWQVDPKQHNEGMCRSTKRSALAGRPPFFQDKEVLQKGEDLLASKTWTHKMVEELGVVAKVLFDWRDLFVHGMRMAGWLEVYGSLWYEGGIFTLIPYESHQSVPFRLATWVALAGLEEHAPTREVCSIDFSECGDPDSSHRIQPDTYFGRS